MADAMKRRGMMREDGILTGIRMEYLRSTSFLTTVTLQFDGYIKHV